MPIAYDIDEAENFICVKLTGNITEQQLMEHAKEFWSDSRLKPGFRELFDASSGSPEDLSPGIVGAILEEDTKYRRKFPGAKTAMVVPDDSAFELAKEFEKDALDGVMVFYSRDVALTWLGYSGPLVQR